ncbi:MAG: hypothetical protein ABEI53_01025 [Candidatus Magasanikbacteria bacterium]
MENVSERINEKLERTDKSIKVRFEHLGSDKIKKINNSFQSCDPREKKELFVDLINLWLNASSRDSDEELFEEAVSVFGKTFKDFGQDCFRIMYSLNGKGDQLRVWYGPPASFGFKHVDSCGRNLLAGVYEHPDTVIEFLKALKEEVRDLTEAEFPNGAKVFMSANNQF